MAPFLPPRKDAKRGLSLPESAVLQGLEADESKKISTCGMLKNSDLLLTFEKKAKKTLRVLEKVVFLQPQKSRERRRLKSELTQ